MMNFNPSLLLKSLVFFSATLMLPINCIFAFPVDVKADFYFGPDMSRNLACENAREAAKSKAIALVTGEKVVYDQKMHCSKSINQAQDPGCAMDRNAWVLVEGQIRKSEVISEVVKTVEGAQVCTVSLVADVTPPSIQADPNFDLQLDLNRNTFRQGENISIKIKPTAPMYVSIFNWKSTFTKDNVFRIFPNEIEKENYITQTFSLPSKAYESSYSLELEWSAPSNYDKDYLTEWIIVVATRKPLEWQSVYDIQRFKEKILEIPPNQRRLAQRAYLLLK